MVSVILHFKFEQCKVYRDIEVCACLKMIVIMINARIRLAYDDDDDDLAVVVVMVICRQW